MAIGADNAVRVNMESKDAYSTAFQIADYAKSNGFDLVITGKETINYNGSQIAGMIAEIMDLPYVSIATKMEMNCNTATVHREIVGGN